MHLFDRDDNLYGSDVQVEFKQKLREEQRFNGLDELKQQIQRDMVQAREFFNTTNTDEHR